MKKIGIVTWYKYYNYGTILQATALQKYLNTSGFESKLINFQLNDSKNNKKNNKHNLYSYISSLLLKISKLIYKNDFANKINKMNLFVNHNCNITERINNDLDYIRITNNFDFIIFGSDQIWNPTWYHPYYFGAFDEIKTKLIAYAPSIGVHNLPVDYIDIYTNNLRRFSAIGMREHYANILISNITNLKVFDVVDPTLLLDNYEWEKYKSLEKVPEYDYILCYLLTDNKNHWKAIKKYAKKTNKKLVIIPAGGFSFFISKNIIRDCGINDFIGLFLNASEILTDSFHGTVFSIIFNKKFHVFERHNPSSCISQNDRIYNLLNISGIGKDTVLLKYNSSVIMDNKSINYDEVNKTIKTIINESKRFLNDNLI